MEFSEKATKIRVLSINDPLHKFLTRRLRVPYIAILCVVMLLDIFVYFGVGSIVSYRLYPRADIFRAFDRESIFFILMAVFVISPIVVYVYLWQPFELGIITVLRSLGDNAVISPDNSHTLEQQIKTSVPNPLFSYGIVILSLILAFVFLLIQHFFVFPSVQERLGKPYYLLYDNKYYYGFILPLLFFRYYMIASVSIRTILSLFWLNKILRNLDFCVHPLHPDGAGGFGELGKLAVRLGAVFAGLGVLASLFTIIRITIGSGWAYPDSLLLYTLYIGLLPVALVSPLWSAHKAMVAARDKILLAISSEFEDILLGKSSVQNATKPQSQEIYAQLTELKSKHALVIETYPTWPLSNIIFRRFSITAVVPLMTTAISILIEWSK